MTLLSLTLFMMALLLLTLLLMALPKTTLRIKVFWGQKVEAATGAASASMLG
jgi:hypothetical protein